MLKTVFKTGYNQRFATLQNSSILIIILFLIIGACDILTFKPEDKFLFDLDPPEMGELDFHLTNFSDTIFVWGNQFNLEYSITTSDSVAFLNFYLDEEFNCSTTDTTQVTIYTQNLTPGSYILQIEICLKTESGSLEDIIGEEYFLGTYQYPLIYYDTVPPYQTQIIAITPESGSLTLTWEKYYFPYFEAYKVFNTKEGNNLIKEITDQNTTCLVDSFFLGGYTQYRVDVEAGNYLFTGEEYEYFDSYNADILNLELIDDFLVEVTWDICPYYQNFSSEGASYNIHETMNPGNNPIAIVYNIEENSIQDEVLFGSNNFYCCQVANPAHDYYDVIGDHAHIEIGNSVPLYAYYIASDVFYIPSHDSFYLVHDINYVLHTTRIDAQSYSSQAETNKAIFFAKDGTSAYSKDYFDDVIIEHDPVSLSTICEYDLSSFIPEGYESCNENYITVLTENKILYLIRNNDETMYRLYYFDLNNIIDPDFLINRFPLDISESGNFILFGSTNPTDDNVYLYQVSGQVLEFLGSKTQEHSDALFISDYQYLIYHEMGECWIYSYPENDFLVSFSLNYGLENINIDPVTELLGGQLSDNNQQIYMTFDLGLLEVIDTIPAITYIDINLYNNVLCSTAGYFYELDNKLDSK